MLVDRLWPQSMAGNTLGLQLVRTDRLWAFDSRLFRPFSDRVHNARIFCRLTPFLAGPGPWAKASSGPRRHQASERDQAPEYELGLKVHSKTSVLLAAFP